MRPFQYITSRGTECLSAPSVWHKVWSLKVSSSFLTVYLLFSLATVSNQWGDTLRPYKYPALHQHFTPRFTNYPFWMCRYFWIPCVVWEFKAVWDQVAHFRGPRLCAVLGPALLNNPHFHNSCPLPTSTRNRSSFVIHSADIRKCSCKNLSALLGTVRHKEKAGSLSVSLRSLP